MPCACAFIRGINVGGRNLLPMADLRRLAADAGLDNPQTLLQSGNLVFNASARAIARAPTALADAIERERGFRPEVIVRTAAEVKDVLDRNPFAERAAADPTHVLVMFLARAAAPGAATALAALGAAGEQFHLVGREVYLDYPNGIGRAKVPMTRVENATGAPGTARNCATLARVLGAAAGLDG